MSPEMVSKNLKDKPAFISIEKVGDFKFSYNMYSHMTERSRHILEGGGSFDAMNLVAILLSDEKYPLEIEKADKMDDKFEEKIGSGEMIWLKVSKSMLN